MSSISNTSEEEKNFKNTYKPLLYINPKDSLEFDKIISKTINEVNDIQIQDSSDNNSEKLKLATITAVGIAANLAYMVLPFGELALPLTAFLVSPLLKVKDNSTKRSKDENQILADSNTLAKFLEKINLTDWVDFVEQISFASIPEELDFPPGHPLPSRLYRVHPLKKKNNRYIPVEIFDSLLYKERESELIKILVDLGAAEISIQELSSNQTQGSTDAKASLIGAGGGSSEVKGENEKSNSTDKIIKLNPKNWTSKNFDSSEYSWLPYEPDWEYIVHARLKGGCISSSVELTSDTSFSISAQLGLTEGLLENLGSLGVGGKISRLQKEKKRFEVKFIDI